MHSSIVGLIVACAAEPEPGCERSGEVHGERDPNKSDRRAPSLLASRDGDRGYYFDLKNDFGLAIPERILAVDPRVKRD